MVPGDFAGSLSTTASSSYRFPYTPVIKRHTACIPDAEALHRGLHLTQRTSNQLHKVTPWRCQRKLLLGLRHKAVQQQLQLLAIMYVKEQRQLIGAQCHRIESEADLHGHNCVGAVLGCKGHQPMQTLWFSENIIKSSY
jgi:hypothetical protein